MSDVCDLQDAWISSNLTRFATEFWTNLFQIRSQTPTLVNSLQAKILGIPLMNDQRPNLKRAARHGNARMLEWSDLTAVDLTSAIRGLIQKKQVEA